MSKSEVLGGGCDRFGRSTAEKAARRRTTSRRERGVEWRFDDDKSIAFANVTAVTTSTDTDEPLLPRGRRASTRSRSTSRARSRSSSPAGTATASRSARTSATASFDGAPWWQGEHQNALKIAPKWVLSQGFEYTTLIGLPTYYFNGGVLYRFTSESNIRVYVGQNRGGLRCVSGICRIFPAFSGARVELTLRF